LKNIKVFDYDKGEIHMKDLIEKRNEIVKMLNALNNQVTNDVLENATKEEMEKYIELINSIVIKLRKLDNMINKNEE